MFDNLTDHVIKIEKEVFKKLNWIDTLDYLQRKYSLDDDELKKYICKNIDKNLKIKSI